MRIFEAVCSRFHLVFVSSIVVIIAACSSSGSGGGGESNPETVDDSLDRLGVDTTETTRLDTDGSELPDDYSPLGASSTTGQTDELVIIGPQILDNSPGGSEPLDNRVIFTKLEAADATGALSFTVTDTLPPGTLWETDDTSGQPGTSNLGPQTKRDAAAADVDGDGVDEIVVVYLDGQDVSGTDQLWLQILDEGAGAPETLVAVPNVRDVAVEAGDFDGDGVTGFAVGISSSDSTRVIVFESDGAGAYTQLADIPFVPVDSSFTSRFSLELAAGALDRDNPDELVVVLNEIASEDEGVARYWVLDDAAGGFDPWVAAQLLTVTQNGVKTAIVADVDLGDIDMDGLDEVVFGGLTALMRNPCGSTEHLFLAFDDGASADARLSLIAGATRSDNYIESGTGCNTNSHDMYVQKAFVNAFDVDGDGRDEVHVGRHIYGFADGSPWTELYALPYDALLAEGQTSGGAIAAATSSIVSGDFTGNGREELAVFFQWRDEISYWGLIGPDPGTATWGRAFTVPTAFYNSQTRVFPILVPGNLDKDGVALKYSEGEYRFFFTEPILIAALAAAPCDPGIGQNIDACVTSYGTTESTDAGVDGTITVSASAWVGGETKIFGVGASVKQKVTRSASFSAGRFYTLEETVEFSTGPVEDTVVFTTIPVDQYTYTVVAHPDPTVEGEQLIINLPRSPITLQVDRTFYNANTEPDEFKVGSNVFLHTPGDIDSYPTEGDADALIDTGGLGHLGPLGDIVDAAGEAIDNEILNRLLGDGLKTSRVTTVGQGTGQTTTEIRFTETTTYRAGAQVAYELEAETTAGVVVGGSIGGSVDAGLSWGGSNSTVYRGTVGSINAADFPSNVYNFGLFTYLYNFGNPEAQQFEVINYWVERVE